MYFRKHKGLKFASISIVLQIRDGAGSPSSWKTRTLLYDKINTIAADVLATQDISTFDFDLIIPEYSGHSAVTVLSGAYKKFRTTIHATCL